MGKRGQRSAAGRWRILHDRRLRRVFAVVLAASLLLVVAIGNLIAVAEGAPVASPPVLPAQSWTAGVGTAEASGQERWTFQVDPMGRRVVDLELAVPYEIRIAHSEGRSQLFGSLRVWVDGEQVRVATRHAAATEADVDTERAEHGDLGPRLDRIVVEREADAPPFPVLVTWDWHYQGGEGVTAYALRVGPVGLEPVALAGLPGCTDSTCARILVIVAVVLQGVAVSWFLRTKERPAREGPPMSRGEPTDKNK